MDYSENIPGEGEWSGSRVMSLTDMLMIIRERWIIAFILSFIASAGYGFWELRQEAVFESRSVMKIDISNDKILDMPETIDRKMFALDLDNHLRQLRGASLVKRVLDSLTDLEKKQMRKAYLDDKGGGSSIESIVASACSFSVISSSHVLNILARHRDKHQTELLANRFAEKYLDLVHDQQRQKTQDALVFLKEQTADLSKNVELAEMAVHEYRQKNNLLSVEDNKDIIAARIQSLTSSLTDVNIKRMALETQIDQAETAKRNGSVLTEISEIIGSGAVLAAYDELANHKAEREILAEEYLERHPVVIENGNKIFYAERRLQEAINRALEISKNKIHDLLAKRAKFQEALLAAEADGLRLDKMEVEYNILLRNMSSAEVTYDQVLRRLNETRVTTQLENNQIRIVDVALPGSKILPIPEKIARGKVIMFFAIFITLPLLLEFFDNRLKTQWDVEHYLHRHLLGDFPAIRKYRSNQIPHIVLDDLDDDLVENFRGLYAHMEVSTKVPIPKIIMITSTDQSEGKSFIASNLSAMFARHKYTVLLIDCDFRRPRQHRDFGVENKYGIIRWFNSENRVSLHESLLDNEDLGIQEIKSPFYLLPAGGTSKNSTEIIRDERFAELLEICKMQFGLVVIDTPPAGLFPDSLMLARYANEALYVCRHNAISRQKAKFFIDQLVSAELELLGVIWNMIKGNTTSGQGYGYGYGHYNYYARRKYYRPDEPEPNLLLDDDANEKPYQD